MVSKKILIIIIVIAVGVSLGVWVWRANTKDAPESILRRDILSTEKEINLTYSGYDPSAATEISGFEEKSDIAWKGNGFYDDRVVLSGKTSLSLTSTNREVGVAYADNLPSFGNVATLEAAVKITDPDDLESLIVYAGTPDQPHAYSFPVSNLHQEWNIVRMEKDKFISEVEPGTSRTKTENNNKETSPTPAVSKNDVPSWDNVTRIEFVLTSRPGATIIANFDSLRIERNKDYREDWNVNIDSFLGLGALNNEIYLLGRGAGAAVATMHAVTSAEDFTYKAKLVPRNDKRSGLFFRGDFRSNNGYIFWVGGVDQSTWGINSRNLGADDVLATGELNNIRFRKDEPIWLKVQTRGEKLTVFISLDGDNYSKLQDVTDTTFLEPGGVGIFVEGGGETLFNDFSFTQ